MKKCAKSAPDVPARAGAAGKAAISEDIGDIQRLFYVDEAEFARLRAEIERPAKVDEGLKRLMRNNEALKWIRK